MASDRPAGVKRSPNGAIALGASASVVVVLPMFLVGASAVELSADFGIDQRGLGLAVGVFNATGMLIAVHVGRFVDRHGSILSVRIGASAAAAACLGVALFADGLVTFVVLMALAGCGNVINQVASNRLLTVTVPFARRGIAFGIKQAAPPAGSMLSGLAVPLVVLRFGWPAAYAVGGVLAAAVIVSAGRRQPVAQRPTPPTRLRLPQSDKGVVLWLSAGIGLAAGASSMVYTFYVDTAVRAGGAQSVAGATLAVASLVSIGTRVGCGIVADRMSGDRLRVVVCLLALGVVGITLLATGVPTLMAIGVVIALAGTWGVNGLFWYAVLRAFHYAPGTVSGVISRSTLVSVTVCPVLFGLAATQFGPRVAWTMAVVVAVLAVVAMSLAARRLAASPPSGEMVT